MQSYSICICVKVIVLYLIGGEPGPQKENRNQNRDDSEEEKEDSSDSECDDMGGKRKRKKHKKAGKKSQHDENDKINIPREQEMRENLHRKSSLLETLKEKYDQVIFKAFKCQHYSQCLRQLHRCNR